MKVVFNDAFIAQRSSDVIITDPQRWNAQDVIEQIMKIAPAKVVYVSCSATQARDLALMDENTKCSCASCRYVSRITWKMLLERR
jgi:23S rRNA (uracil1939-C5)-methyltransferase